MKAGVNAAIRAYVDAALSEDTCSAVVRVVTGLRADLAEMREARDRLLAEIDRAEESARDMRAGR